MRYLIIPVLAGGLLLRLLTARGTFLNPDEAIVFLVANQPNLSAVIQAGLTQPHPPLTFILLYFWRLLGTSELWLRLFSVLTGTAAVFFLYRYLRLKLDQHTALSGAVLFSFLPAVVGLSAEVRQYALLLFLMTVALYLLELGFSQSRSGALFLSGIFSALAGATQYSGLVLSVALGALFLFRAISEKVKKPLWLWGGLGQLFALITYAFFYFTHIVHLKGSPMQQFALTGWLRASYFHPELESPIRFLLRTTFDLFSYLFSSRPFGIVGLLLFLFGTVFTIIRRHWNLTILLIAPFVTNILCALFHLLPYGGTRHSIVLALFVVIGITAALSSIPKKEWLKPATAGILMLATNIFLTPPAQHISRPNARQELMHRAIATLKDNAPGGDTIFADYQSSALLSYYLADHTKPVPFFGKTVGPFWEFNYGGYLVVSSTEWSFNRLQFLTVLESLFHYYPFRDNRTIWVFDGGWGMPLVSNQPELGSNLAVFPVTAPTAATESLLIAACEEVRPLVKVPLNSVILPSRYYKTSTVNAARPLAQQVLSYTELYLRAKQGQEEFDACLPALAFWVFHDPAWHPEFMAYMADGESYISAGYRFTLLLMDVTRQIAVYQIEKIEQ